MDFSIFRPQNLSKSEPIYAYKRYAYKKNMYSQKHMPPPIKILGGIISTILIV